eukprot:168704_1
MSGNEVVVGCKYVIQAKIGCGSFGEIYSAYDKDTGDKYAAKAERIEAKHPQLKFEKKVYDALPPSVGIPRIYWSGISGKCNVMIMELLGDSLEILFTACSRKFSLKTVLLIGMQLLDRIQHLHDNDFVHRDIKPDNFLIGLGRTVKTLYMIDMGLCKQYRSPTIPHIPYRTNKRLTGTPRYASIQTHKGVEQSRRDDLESLGYMLIYFCKGKLPWMGLKAKTKQEKYDSIGYRKKEISLDDLCLDLPEEFMLYLKHCRNLEFTQTPDYDYLRLLFEKLFKRRGFKNDGKFDWESFANQKIPSSSSWHTPSTPAVSIPVGQRVVTPVGSSGLPPMATKNYVRRTAVQPPQSRVRRGYSSSARTPRSSPRMSDESSGFSDGGGGRTTSQNQISSTHAQPSGGPSGTSTPQLKDLLIRRNALQRSKAVPNPPTACATAGSPETAHNIKARVEQRLTSGAREFSAASVRLLVARLEAEEAEKHAMEIERNRFKKRSEELSQSLDRMRDELDNKKRELVFVKTKQNINHYNHQPAAPPSKRPKTDDFAEGVTNLDINAAASVRASRASKSPTVGRVPETKRVEAPPASKYSKITRRPKRKVNSASRANT